MATIVNTPAATREHIIDDPSSNSLNIVIGLVATLIIAFLLLYFGLPLIRSAANQAGGQPQQINNYAPPQGGNQAPQINIPDKVNVDINPNAGGGSGGNAPAPQK